jgi:hypothetical protein
MKGVKLSQSAPQPSRSGGARALSEGALELAAAAEGDEGGGEGGATAALEIDGGFGVVSSIAGVSRVEVGEALDGLLGELGEAPAAIGARGVNKDVVDR